MNMNTIMKSMKRTMKRAKRKQRGMTLVEMLVVLGIMAVITPALATAVITMMATPQDAHASLTSTRDANYAAEVITIDANCANDWTGFEDYSTEDQEAYPDDYGRFTWTDTDGTNYVVRYYYDDGNLVRQQTKGADVGPGIIIAEGLGDRTHVSFTKDPDGRLFVTVSITCAQKDAQGQDVEAVRTFRAWMRTGVHEDVWGLRRRIDIFNPNPTRMEDYTMLLDLTGEWDEAEGKYGLEWDIAKDIADGYVLGTGQDLRFVRHAQIYVLPITISDPADNHHVQVLIDATDGIGDDAAEQEKLLNNMAPNYDGSDIRFFSVQLPDKNPYNWEEADGFDRSDWADADKLHHWVRERTDTKLDVWVNVPEAGMTEIYMYFGDPLASNESSVEWTFSDAQFTDSFDVPLGDPASLIDGLESEHIIVDDVEGVVRIDLTTDIVGDAGFELDDGSWTGFATNSPWPFLDPYYVLPCDEKSTELTYSAKVGIGDALFDAPAGSYAEVRQTVDLTYVDAISFDAIMWAKTNMYSARVYVDGDLLWSQKLTSTETTVTQQINVESYTGNHTIRFRVYEDYYDITEGFDTGCWIYWDNIRTVQWAEVTSVEIPQDAASCFAIGDELSWIEDTFPGQTWIKYQAEGYTGGSWVTIPDSIVPGNEDWLTQSDVDLSSITIDYDPVRVVAHLCTLDDTISPELQSWTVDYFSRNGSALPDTTYDVAAFENPVDSNVVTSASFEVFAHYYDPEDAVDDPDEDDPVWDPGYDDLGDFDNEGRGNVKIWVKFPQIPPGMSHIYVYYGNTKAISLPDPWTADDEDIREKYFFDPFDDWSLIDTDETHHVQISGGQVEVVLADDVVANPGFEFSTDWYYHTNDDDLACRRTTDWYSPDDEDTSVQMCTSASDEDGNDNGLLFVWKGHYAEATQANVELTDVQTIEFDARLYQQAGIPLLNWGVYQAQVYANGQRIWSMNLPTTTQTYTGEDCISIDIGDLGLEGAYTLKFRVTLVDAVAFLFFPGCSLTLDAYFDNIRTVGYTGANDEIVVTSVPIPVDGETIVEGFDVYWTDDCPDQGVDYHVEYDANRDLENPDWQMIDNNMFQGAQQNGQGFFTSGSHPPIEFNSDPPGLEGYWDDKDNIRIIAHLEVEDEGHLPTIQEWLIIYEREALAEPRAGAAIYGPDSVTHELPISAYGVSLGEGDGVETEFELENTPIEGTVRVYVKRQSSDNPILTTSYTIDYDERKIIFDEAPANHDSITADYCYWM